MTPKEIVKTWFKNIDEKNYDGVKALMDAQHQFHNPMTPAPIGIEEHIGMIQMMSASFEGTHHILGLVEEGEWVAVAGRWEGKHIGEFEGIAATGNDVSFTWSDFFQIKDGKVVNEHFEMNPGAIMAQIGAVPA